MPDVVIERCVVRVVRTAGWAWGPDPRALVDRIVQALPSLLAQELAGVLDGDDTLDDVVVDEVVVLSVNLGKAASGSSIERAVAAPELAREIGAALTASLEPRLAMERQTSDATACRATRYGTVSVDQDEKAIAGATIAMLRRWHADGVLEERLVLLDRAALDLVESALSSEIGDVTARSRQTEEEIRTTVADAARLRPAPRHQHARQRWRLTLAVEIVEHAAQTRRRWPQSTILEALRAAVTPEAITTAPPDIADGVVARAPITRRQAAALRPLAPPRQRSPRVPVDGEVRVPSALPFLLLRPWQRLGYLGAVAALLEQHSDERAQVFGCAMAYKLLRPLEGGWRRAEGDRVAAAAFAGRHNAVPDPDVHALAHNWRGGTALLDTAPAMALRPGRASGPVRLTHERAGYVLWEPDGTFPIQCATQLTELFSTLGHWDSPIVTTSLPTAALIELERSGFHFVTDTAPGRAQQWHAAPGRRVWSNRPIDRWEQFDVADGDFYRDTWTAIGERRLAFPLLPLCGLEQTLTLGAALGLGALAWELWHERERTSPVLAMDRFGDLDGLVRFAPDAISVRLPLGQRYLDLERHGCLQTIHGVPWLDNRPVEFARW